MAFRFRKSIKLGPLRINFSKSGVGYSVGNKFYRVTKKANGGMRTTATLPGTGISDVKDYSKDQVEEAAQMARTRRKKKLSRLSAARPRCCCSSASSRVAAMTRLRIRMTRPLPVRSRRSSPRPPQRPQRPLRRTHPHRPRRPRSSLKRPRRPHRPKLLPLRHSRLPKRRRLRRPHSLPRRMSARFTAPRLASVITTTRIATAATITKSRSPMLKTQV